MSRRGIIVGAAMLLFAGLGLWLSSQPDSPPPSRYAPGAPMVAQGTGPSAGTTPQPAHPPEEAGCALSGRVLTTDGRVLAGATVSAVHRFSPEVPFLARTDAQGRWSLCHLPAGRYALSATAPNYPPASRALTVRARESLTDVDFRLEPGGLELWGKVMDIGGGAIAGAQIIAVEQVPAPEFGQTGPRPVALTDAEGQYRLRLTEGVYGVTASHPDYVAGDAIVQISSASRVQDFLLTPAASIQGRVLTREGGTPVAGAQVTWIPVRGEPGGIRFSLGGEPPLRVSTDASGNFTLRPLPSGSFRLQAFADGRMSEPLMVNLGIASQVRDVVLLVERSLSISGHVVQKGLGTPITGARVSSIHPETQEELQASAVSDETGAFQILVPGFGRYRLITTGAGFVPRLFSPVVDVSDASIEGVRVEVDAGATVRGRVEPATEAWITIEPRQGVPGRSSPLAAMQVLGLQTRSTLGGAFELAGVPPGVFSLVATTLDARRGVAEVEVGTSDPESVLIRLAEGGRIAGRVVDEQGRPLQGVTLRAALLSGNGALQGSAAGAGFGGGMTREDGTFELKGLAAGTYRLEAEDEAGALAVREPAGGGQISVPAGQSVAGVAVIVESRSCKIQGLVRAASGGSQPDAWVTVKQVASSSRADAGPVGASKVGGGSRMALSGSNGFFSVDRLRCGTYEITAFSPDTAEAGQVQSETGRDSVEVQLEPGLSLQGSVRRAGSPVRQFSVVAQGPAQYQSQTRDETGRFKIPGVLPGRYSVGVSSEEGSAFKVVELSASTGPLEFELEPWGSVSGTVIDAATQQPLQGHDILVKSGSGLNSFDNLLALVSHDGPRTDGQGRFRIERLAAGTGRLLVISGPAERFRILASRTFTLEPGQHLQLGALETGSAHQTAGDR